MNAYMYINCNAMLKMHAHINECLDQQTNTSVDVNTLHAQFCTCVRIYITTYTHTHVHTQTCT